MKISTTPRVVDAAAKPVRNNTSAAAGDILDVQVRTGKSRRKKNCSVLPQPVAPVGYTSSCANYAASPAQYTQSQYTQGQYNQNQFQQFDATQDQNQNESNYQEAKKT